MIKGPCKDCKKRYVGCHGKCEDYAAYRAELDKQREERKTASIVNELNYAAIRKHVNLRAKQKGG